MAAAMTDASRFLAPSPRSLPALALTATRLAAAGAGGALFLATLKLGISYHLVMARNSLGVI